MTDCLYLSLRKEKENRCPVLTSSTRREISMCNQMVTSEIRE